MTEILRLRIAALDPSGQALPALVASLLAILPNPAVDALLRDLADVACRFSPIVPAATGNGCPCSSFPLRPCSVTFPPLRSWLVRLASPFARLSMGGR